MYIRHVPLNTVCIHVNTFTPQIKESHRDTSLIFPSPPGCYNDAALGPRGIINHIAWEGGVAFLGPNSVQSFDEGSVYL